MSGLVGKMAHTERLFSLKVLPTIVMNNFVCCRTSYTIMAFLILHNGLTGIAVMVYAIQNLFYNEEGRESSYEQVKSNKLCLHGVSLYMSQQITCNIRYFPTPTPKVQFFN